jgi:glycosyltransferase involved in cell wall biosynthesis
MNLKIILIGNYRPDKQFSMKIFEELIAEGYIKANLSVNIIRPKAIFGKVNGNNSSLFKWMGYVDKFLIFPMQLLVLRLKNFIFFKKVYYHICDHSNAFYLYFLPKKESLISCHDVLAIRAGLGYTDTYCSSTKSGKVLQKIILNGLSGANKLAAVSEFTLNQLAEIDTKPNLKKNWCYIHNALSDKFIPMPKDEIQEVLKKFKLIYDKTFILHIGSDLERKNRKLIIEMIYELHNEWDGLVVFAGASLTTELLDLAERLKVTDRIVQINFPSDKEIIALYTICHAMIFPSYSEGFGWPIIEAQACGAPVITSNKAPMMDEVGGKAALYADPNDASSFANQFRKLNDEGFKNEIIRVGYENAKRFDFNKTMSQYIELITK